MTLGHAVVGFERPDVREALGVPWASTGGFRYAAGHWAGLTGKVEVRLTATAVDGERFDLDPQVVDLPPAPPPVSVP